MEISIFLGKNHRLDFLVTIVVARLQIEAYDTMPAFIFLPFSKK
jgi:hypothetical protein